MKTYMYMQRGGKLLCYKFWYQLEVSWPVHGDEENCIARPIQGVRGLHVTRNLWLIFRGNNVYFVSLVLSPTIFNSLSHFTADVHLCAPANNCANFRLLEDKIDSEYFLGNISRKCEGKRTLKREWMILKCILMLKTWCDDTDWIHLSQNRSGSRSLCIPWYFDRVFLIILYPTWRRSLIYRISCSSSFSASLI
jgi:hypothetical protein